ncbi:MAG TPA: glycosyltransferase 87 family protein [Acidimicrobiales bacterium]
MRQPMTLSRTTWLQYVRRAVAGWGISGLWALSLVLWFVVALQLWRVARQGTPMDLHVYRSAAANMLRHGDTYRAHFTFAHLNFTYPPFALLLFSALTLVPAIVMTSLWWLCSCVALIAIVTLALRQLSDQPMFRSIAIATTLSGAACVFLEPLRSDLAFGQINIFLMLAVLLDLVVVRSSAKGVLTGLAAAIKLTPLIYFSYFVIVRRRAAFVTAVAALGIATALAWILLPTDSTTYWFHQAFSPGHKGGSSNVLNQSWYGLVSHFSSSLGMWTNVVWLVLSGATFVLGVLLARRYVASQRTIEAVLALALTELLVSPVSWAHHWSWIVLVPLLLFFQWRRERPLCGASLLLLLVAVAFPYRWYDHRWYQHGLVQVLLGYSLLLSGVILLITMVVTEWRHRERDLEASNVRPVSLVGEGSQ